MASENQHHDHGAEFSVVPSGPISVFYERGPAPVAERVPRTMVAVLGITWLPLAVLTVVTGVAWSNTRVPFFHDVSAQVRLLVALPLLIAGELYRERRLRSIVAQFSIRELVAPEDKERYERALAKVVRVKQSKVAELLMVALALAFGYWLWRDYVALHIETWYGAERDHSFRMTVPGLWYAYVSQPLFRFLLLRWYFSIVLWCWFLWKVSRIPLRLDALHPDEAGGLGFLEGSSLAFFPLLVAQSLLGSATVWDRIWLEGIPLPNFRLEIGIIVGFLVVIVLLPQAAFIFQLSRCRRVGKHEYGAKASEYVKAFWRKWGYSGEPQRESFLGSPDIQSLADLGNSFKVVREMGLLPFGKRSVVQLIALVLVPYLPLALTMVPLEEVINKAVKLIL